MEDDLKNRILTLYPEYDKITGPTISSAGRVLVNFRNSTTGEKTTRQLGKVKLEVKINRRLTGDETVDHKDNDKTNDDFDNLQVLTRTENARKGSLNNTYTLGYKQSEEQKRSGAKNGMALFSDEEVKKIREDFHDGLITKKDIVNDNNINRRTAENILRGVSYVNAEGPIVDSFSKGRPKKAGVAKLVETQRA